MSFSTTSRDQYLRNSLIFNFVIGFCWWLVFFPGFFSTDSFAIIQNVQSRTLSSEWTLPWHLFIAFLTFDGAFPGIATLFFLQLFIFSVTVLSFTICKPKVATLSSAAISATPLVGAMGITLWHDIPMTSGLILFITGILKLQKRKPHGYVLVFIGLFFSSFRFNGIPSIIIFLLLLLMRNTNRRKYFGLFLLASVFLFGNFALNSHFPGRINVQSVGITDWMKYDISCFAGKSSREDFYQGTGLSNYSIDDWASVSACEWFNKSPIGTGLISVPQNHLVRGWLTLLKTHPQFALKIHFERHHNLLPISLNGIKKVPFINTNIQANQMNIDFEFPGAANLLRIYPRAWNFLSLIFAQSGLWLFILFMLAWFNRSKDYLYLVSLGLVLTLLIFVFGPIPDARFSLFNLVVGQLVCLQKLFQKLCRET